MKIKNEYVKIINSLSFPILMNYLISSVFDILDRAIVGHYSADGFAAVGIASSVIYVITGSLGIFSTAFNIVAAEMVGKGDEDMFKKAFSSSIITTLFIGISFIILSLLGGKVFFRYAYGLNGSILNTLLDYYYPASVTVLLNMILFLFSAYFRNKKNTRIALYSTAAATLINIFFDYSLVYGKFGFLELGVSGAAWGSIIGLLAGIMVYVIAMIIDDKKIMHFSFSTKCTWKMIRLYVPLLGQDIMEGTVFTMIVSGIVSRLGIYAMASYSLLQSLGSMIILPVYAYSTAAMTLAMQKKAVNDKSAVKSILRIALFLSLIVIVSISIICIVFTEKIMGLIVSDRRTIENTKILIIYLIIAQIINVFREIYKGYLQGTGSEKFVFTVSFVISLLSVTWTYLLSKVAGIGGVYAGLALNYLGLSLIYSIKIRKCNFA